MKAIRIIEVKSEIGAGARGASLGVDAIKIAALDFGSDFFKRYQEIVIENDYASFLEPNRTPFARRIRSVIPVFEKVCNEVAGVLKSGDFPIILSGDHSTAAATIAGIKTAYPDCNLGVVWMDAHADLHSPFTTPTGNMHGMPISVSLAEDNLINKINNPDELTVDLWNKLKTWGGIAPKIKYENLIYVSMRDVEPQEEFLINSHKVRNFSADEINTFGTEKVTREILSKLDNCDKIYISFDVDAMDSSISKGTGTPVPNGITEKQAANLILRLMQNEKVCCFEISEVNPTLDKENLMAENVFEILQKVTNQLMYQFED